MNKIVTWIGVAIFILAALCFFLAGSTSGPSPEQATPTVPFLYGTNQFYWILLGGVGIIAIIAGLIIPGKNKDYI